MPSENKDTEQTIAHLQLIEQSVQNLQSQKQQFQMQIVEIESALKEIEPAKEAYKIVGNIMVLSDKSELKKDLESKKSILDLRIKSIDKQENQLREKSQKIRSKVMEDMDSKD